MEEKKCNCKNCSPEDYKKVNTGIFLIIEDVETFDLISTRISCAEQILRIQKVDEEYLESYQAMCQAAINTKADNMFLHKKAWKDIIKKYNLSTEKEYYIDFSNNEFYTMEKK